MWSKSPSDTLLWLWSAPLGYSMSPWGSPYIPDQNSRRKRVSVRLTSQSRKLPLSRLSVENSHHVKENKALSPEIEPMTLKVPLGIASQALLRGALLPIIRSGRASLAEVSVSITPLLRSRELIRSPKYPQPQFSTLHQTRELHYYCGICYQYVSLSPLSGVRETAESTPRPLD